jgi:phosphoglycolate phosphatase-like HAD superfamily hydrolase
VLPSLPPPPCLCRWVCTECKYDHCNKCNKKLALEKLNEERQAQANAVIAEMETEARDNMTLMPGVHELLAVLDAWGLPRGILTRNVTTSVDWLHNTHLQVLTC